MSEVNKVISVASNEIGYLEKMSNVMLDDKTANAGRNNFTKYWRDLKYNGLQGQPWCLCFVIWCFVKAFGASKGKSMLCMSDYTFYTPTAAQYFKNMKRWYSYPKVGDVIFFKNSQRICHVGIVCQITSDRIYTIEGNTNGGSTLEANGGAVAKKSYPLNYSRIAGFGRPKYDEDVVIKPPIPNAKPILKKGSKGPQVVYLQQCLNFLGAKLVEDGDFGKKTDAALKAFQTKYKLVVDGEYGPKSKAMLERVIASENQR